MESLKNVLAILTTHMETRLSKDAQNVNLVPRASVAFPQKASRPADTPGKRRPDWDKFSLAQTDVLRPLKLARSHRAGSVEELTV